MLPSALPEATPAPSVLAGLRAALRPHAPFSAMPEADLDFIVRQSRLRYFAPGEVILDPAAGPANDCHVIRQGVVLGERIGAGGGEATAVWELTPGEMFPLGALLAKRAVTSLYRAGPDTFCLVFPREVFDQLIARDAVFRDFCNRRLAHLLDLSRRNLQSEYAENASERLHSGTPLGMVLRHAPIVRRTHDELGETLAAMEKARIGCMPVVDDAQKPLGILTLHDVISRVVLPQRPLTARLGEVMTAPAISLSASATVGDATLMMARHGIRHVIVVDPSDRVCGVVSERDLFSLQRLSVRDIASTIARAADVEDVTRCAADVRAVSHALVAQGVAAGQLTRLISSLNDRIAQRLLKLIAPKHDLSGLALCWLGMGSEGRGEQTLATDQDNGLIFVAQDEQASNDAVRERLLPFAREVNEALDRCGYPLCRGNVMAMNPRWCASLSEWRSTFVAWIDQGGPESLLAANIFFDFRPLWGRLELAHALRSDIADRARANKRFLKQLSDSALRSRPPLNWRGEIVPVQGTAGIEGFDLKMSGSAPFVDAARVLALASGGVATSTVERLQQAGSILGIPVQEVRAWCDAFEYVQLLRLRGQHRLGSSALGKDGANPNHVALEHLSALDQRILKEALRQARKLQQRLELDYPG